MSVQKYTLTEVSGLIGRLQLFTITYLCEICDRNHAADMAVVTQSGVPIFCCLTCASTLVGISKKRGVYGGKKKTNNGVYQSTKLQAKAKNAAI